MLEMITPHREITNTIVRNNCIRRFRSAKSVTKSLTILGEILEFRKHTVAAPTWKRGRSKGRM